MSRRIELIKEQSQKPGLRGKINAKCIECIYDEQPGNGKWRQQVEACTCYACPLYDVRPKSYADGDDNDVTSDE